MRPLLALAALLLVGCGGSDTAAPDTTAPVVTAAPTTAEATTAPPTTLSREARLAVSECLDALGFTLPAQVTLGGDHLALATAACGEAERQVGVDGGDTAALHELNRVLAGVFYDLSTGGYDDAALEAFADALAEARAALK